MDTILMNNHPVLFFFLLLWAIFWKGCSVWFAAKDEKKAWFWVLLIINTFGILELVYIFGVSKRKWADVKALFVKPKPQTEIPTVETEEPKTE